MKIKTHSGAKKRVKVSGTGKKRFKKGYKRHLLTNKSDRQKGVEDTPVHKSDKRAVERMLPNC